MTSRRFSRSGWRQRRKMKNEWIPLRTSGAAPITTTALYLLDDDLKQSLNLPQELTVVGGYITVTLQSNDTTTPPSLYGAYLAKMSTSQVEVVPSGLLLSPLNSDITANKTTLWNLFTYVPGSTTLASVIVFRERIKAKRRLNADEALVWVELGDASTVRSVDIRLLVRY